MDFLRSCYSVDWQFGRGLDTAARVQWYFCDPAAPFFEGPSPFRSLNWWDKDGPPPAIGEQWPGNREYSTGATIPGYTLGPPCGTADQFRDGVSSPPPPTPNRNADGVPDCCFLCAPFAFDYGPYLQSPTWAYRLADVNPGPNFYHFWFTDMTGQRDFFVTYQDVACTNSTLAMSLVYRDGFGHPYVIYPCSLISYDPNTLISVWQLPLDATYHPGELVRVKWPSLDP